MRATSAVLAASLGLVLWLLAPAAAASDSGTIASLANDARSDQGLTRLVRAPALDEVAAGWARQLRRNGSLSHNPAVGDQIPSGWRAWGENVASGQSDGASMHAAWMGSSGHRANILGDYTHVGVAFLRDGSTTWGVQVFARYDGGGPSGSTPGSSDGAGSGSTGGDAGGGAGAKRDKSGDGSGGDGSGDGSDGGDGSEGAGSGANDEKGDSDAKAGSGEKAEGGASKKVTKQRSEPADATPSVPTPTPGADTATVPAPQAQPAAEQAAGAAPGALGLSTPLAILLGAACVAVFVLAAVGARRVAGGRAGRHRG